MTINQKREIIFDWIRNLDEDALDQLNEMYLNFTPEEITCKNFGLPIVQPSLATWTNNERADPELLCVAKYLPEEKICTECGGSCVTGKAFLNPVVGSDDQFGGTKSRIGLPAKMVECLKCTACGHSFIAD